MTRGSGSRESDADAGRRPPRESDGCTNSCPRGIELTHRRVPRTGSLVETSESCRALVRYGVCTCFPKPRHPFARMVPIMNIDKVLYTAKTHTTGGRDGASRSDDRRLDVKLSSPGSAGSGTNPEQLLAAGWSACFVAAMQIAANKMKVVLPADMAIDAEVDLGTTDGAYFLQARLNVSLPGVDARSPRRSSIARTRRVRIPKPHTATSTSPRTSRSSTAPAPEVRAWTEVCAPYRPIRRSELRGVRGGAPRKDGTGDELVAEEVGRVARRRRVAIVGGRGRMFTTRRAPPSSGRSRSRWRSTSRRRRR